MSNKKIPLGKLEINLVVRDNKGRPQGRKKFEADTPSGLSDIYERNRVRKPKKKK